MLRMLFMVFTLAGGYAAIAQDELPEATSEEGTGVVKYRDSKPAKTFESAWLIDNQTATVPTKGTFEMDILHRFGVIENGYDDFYGFFASSNIRIGMSYVPVKNLQMGFALTKANMTWDFYAKYAIIKQSKNVKWACFDLSYYGNIGVESRNEDFYYNKTDRIKYFNQLILGRRFHERFAAQIAPSWTHVNVVDGYFSGPGEVSAARKHDHFAMAAGCSVMLKENMNFLVNYDQPLTKHKSGNPHPNLSFGLEFVTSSHAFQVFAGHYYYISPQLNNYNNQNDWKDFLLGFNITRLF